MKKIDSFHTSLSSFSGYLMIRTKSIAGSILAHNLLRGETTIVQLVLYLIYR